VKFILRSYYGEWIYGRKSKRNKWATKRHRKHKKGKEATEDTEIEKN